MMGDDLGHELRGVPISLREARSAFAAQIRSSFTGAGLDELPTNGALVVGDPPEVVVVFSPLISQRRSSMERFETIERLFGLNYLEGPEQDPSLTERGIVPRPGRRANSSLAASLREHLGDEGMDSFVRGLLFLIAVKESTERAS